MIFKRGIRATMEKELNNEQKVAIREFISILKENRDRIAINLSY